MSIALNIPGILAADNPLVHVIDSPLVQTSGGVWLVSNVTILLVIVGVALIVGLSRAASKIRTGPHGTIDDFRARGLWANFVESVCLYLRNDVFKPVLLQDTDKYTPILWTFFWFILANNILGLIPLKDFTALLGINHGHGIGGTATQSLWVTGALALMAFLLINVSGLVKDPVSYIKHLTGGAPPAMWIILIPVELLGMFIKPFALAMRLFANMTGGHMIIAVMLGFVKMLVDGLGVVGGVIGIIPVGAAIAIYFLEILVAFIQAFVFTFLTCLFLGQLVVHSDEDHGHGDEARGHGH